MEEYFPAGLTPEETVCYISREKSQAVASDADEIVITADTMVFLDDKKLGKPADEAEALQMLTALQGRRHTVCTGVTVRQGETVCLMGPSGLGKTTLLRCVAGLETPDAGAVTGVPRRLGYVFQEDRLCDNFSAVANIRLVTGRTLPEKAILQHLEELGLSDSVRLPVSQLSGGMRRRVAIARAVCCGPELLLLDEAFKGLDEQCRRDTAAYIRRHTAGASVLCVTHDPEEATLLGGRCIDLAALQRRD